MYLCQRSFLWKGQLFEDCIKNIIFLDGEYLAIHNMLPRRVRLEELGGASVGGGRVENGFCALLVLGFYFFQTEYGGGVRLKALFSFKWY